MTEARGNTIREGGRRKTAYTDTLDYYPTPPHATTALLAKMVQEEVAVPNGFIWECACGGGHMAEPLREWFGEQVWETDIFDHKNRGVEIVDFLDPLHMPDQVGEVGMIITNPPFQLAKEFALTALERCPKALVALFCRLSFLEGQQRRKELFDPFPPSHVWVFSQRVQLRKGMLAAKGDGGSMVAHAWFLWDRRGEGTKLGWI